MNSAKHLIISFLLTLLISIIGTVGYMTIEGWNLLDSIYMTVTTISTVGYSEVHKLSRFGIIFTSGLIFIGVGFCLYMAGAMVQFMVEGRIRAVLGRRRLDNKISKLKNHYIICGYGRIGKVLCSNLLVKKNFDLIVIESKKDLIPAMEEEGVLFLSRDAVEEDTLIRAGIKTAKGLVAVLASDADNVFLVLTARQLNPDLYITARATRNEAKSKLIAAGANNVVSPYELGALTMSQRILRPAVTNFLDLAFNEQGNDIRMEEIPVGASSKIINIMLKDSGIRQKYNLIIIAIKKHDGNMTFNPSSETKIQAGDTVIVVGQDSNLQKLEKVLQS
ncbi:MAG: potassium channel protein [Desulfobacterium sp.]|nr:potassium channel protein [Desulfobacterium sp.]MBU3946766.1 potassium channel protein [Pseudomonadota bacterium]MBU4009838.1 potassium channel protein [Pseudomonadota bacterium]MBU4036753.1 potassium channel protein [Pseudomonadota bacterium]